MNTILLQDQPINYSIVRAKRKTVKIKILPTCNLEITAPFHFPEADIITVLQQKSRWILRKIDDLKKLAANLATKELVDGATLLLLGLPKTLVIRRTQNLSQPLIELGDTFLAVQLPQVVPYVNQAAWIKSSIKKWYVEYSAQHLSKRTAFWSNKIGSIPKRITIRDQKTRWGSCSTLGNINYNWRIIMAPLEVIDYLVIHELCHLLVPNHSKQFWNTVAAYSPNYKAQRKWLKSHASTLSAIL